MQTRCVRWRNRSFARGYQTASAVRGRSGEQFEPPRSSIRCVNLPKVANLRFVNLRKVTGERARGLMLRMGSPVRGGALIPCRSGQVRV